MGKRWAKGTFNLESDSAPCSEAHQSRQKLFYAAPREISLKQIYISSSRNFILKFPLFRCLRAHYFLLGMNASIINAILMHIFSWLFVLFRSFLFSSDGQTLPINRRQKAYANGTLIIEQLQRAEDAGTYTCMAQNKQKQTARRNVEIQVLSKFSFRLFLCHRFSIHSARIFRPIFVFLLEFRVFFLFAKQQIKLLLCLNLNKCNSFFVTKVPPKIMPIQAMTNMLKEGMRAAISCQILEGDLPVTFRWERNGKPLLGTG